MTANVKILGPHFSSFARSVMIACEEKGIGYEYGVEYEGEAIKLGDERHRTLHPFAKIPVLLVEGQTIAETGAILRYLDEAFEGAKLQPDTPLARADVDQWGRMISGYIDQAIIRNYLLEFAFPKGEGGSVRMDKVEAAVPDLQYALTTLAEKLGDHTYLCTNRYSLADILLLPILDYLDTSPGGSYLQVHPNLVSYLQRLREKSAVKRVLEK